MKQIFTLLLFFGSITYSFSQQLNNQQIESDLYNSYQKIWSYRYGGAMIEGDSLAIANNTFRNKIEKYTSTFPKTLTTKFETLRKRKNIFIVDSEDQLLRIYSWNTLLGGTKVDFGNVFQYKGDRKVYSRVTYNKPDFEEGVQIPFYSQIFTLRTSDKTYYLGINNNIFSTRHASQSIRIFTIENNNLNDSVALIKTQNGFVNTIDFYFDFLNLADRPERPLRLIKYNSDQKIISIPTLNSNGTLSNSFVRYKFTGQYFEYLDN
jgi:hypothetical protein